MKVGIISSMLVAVAVAAPSGAAEPNESFEAATVLSPGALSVSDSLTIGQLDEPDTLLGIRDAVGDIYFVDDDGSPFGSGTASGAEGVSTNSGSIDFVVSGTGDDGFIGDHSQVGEFEVLVSVYDTFEEPLDSFSQTRRLDPGIVQNFSFYDVDWLNGTYDVFIDNTVDVNPNSDIDFFTFTGLPLGGQFSARTAGPNGNGIDTLLGWFDSDGLLLEYNDNGGGGNLSLIQGNVPASGTLTLAVTGHPDQDFTGAHSQEGGYELHLEIETAELAGDYNGNGTVDAADYVLWRATFAQVGSNLAADGNGNNVVDSGDYDVWRANFGQTSGTVQHASQSVPEPTTTLLLVFAITAMRTSRKLDLLMRFE